MSSQEIAAEFTRGGYTLVAILLLSLLAILIAAERVVATFGVVRSARKLLGQISQSLLRGDLAQARSVCERSRVPAADLFLAGFSRLGHANPQAMGAAIERERTILLLRLKTRLWALGTIGTIAPFVGLFGTVLGIRSSMASMAASGTGGFAVVAGGISGALVATAAGIIVAVEAVVLYNYFQARLGRVSAELRLIAEEFAELASELPIAPVADAAAAKENRRVDG